MPLFFIGLPFLPSLNFNWPGETCPTGHRLWPGHSEAERVEIVGRGEIHQRPDLAHGEEVAEPQVCSSILDIACGIHFTYVIINVRISLNSVFSH